MSYNIDSWDDRENKDFFVDSDRLDTLGELFVPGEKLPSGYKLKPGEEGVALDGAEVGEIAFLRGVDGTSRIAHIELWGEFSGIICGDVLYSFLTQTRGYYKALLSWEGGDSIHWLIVNDGVITEEDV